MLVQELPHQENTSVPQSEVSIFGLTFYIAKLLTTEDEFRGPPRGGRFDRYDDRRGGYGGGGRYDDNYRGSSRYDDRERRSYGRRDDYGSRNIDRYASSGREDRYTSRGDDRRGGYESYGRDGGRSSHNAAYGEPAPSRDVRDSYGGGRSHDDHSNDRYSRR